MKNELYNPQFMRYSRLLVVIGCICDNLGCLCLLNYCKNEKLKKKKKNIEVKEKLLIVRLN